MHDCLTSSNRGCERTETDRNDEQPLAHVSHGMDQTWCGWSWAIASNIGLRLIFFLINSLGANAGQMENF